MKPLVLFAVSIWSAKDLRNAGTKPGAGFSSESLGRFGNHYVMLAHRQGPGSAEIHETEADLFVIQTGTAKLTIGGKVVSPKTTSPHEIRGAGIEGGEERLIGPGDIVHIPAKTPHRLVPDGKLTYFVMKVKGQ